MSKDPKKRGKGIPYKVVGAGVMKVSAEDILNTLESSAKEPWEALPEVWPTPAKYFQWVRNQMRRAWSRHPIKVAYKKAHRERGCLGKKTKTNPTGVVWCSRCEQCGVLHREANTEVDHIEQAGSFRHWGEFLSWMQRLMHISFDSIRVVCKPCHKIITHATKKGMTFEEAKLDKRVIAFGKLPAKEQMSVLRTKNVDGPHTPNAVQRKIMYRQYLEGLDNGQENNSE